MSRRNRLARAAFAGAILAAPASAQEVLHYWDFSTTDDSVGGVTSTVVGTPDRSVHPTYGEAYPGAGPSLNTLISGINNGSGFLEAAVFTGTTPQLQLGSDSFSMSCWIYDDFASDMDVRGPRLFDCLDGTTTGLQHAGNLSGAFIFRADDDMGAASVNISTTAFPIQDRWHHVVVTVDRPNDLVSFYVDGALTETFVAGLTGDLFPTQDLWIGSINGGTNAGQAQTQGMDDLAFYRGLLRPEDAAALASGAINPSVFRPVGQGLCSPATANSTGAPAILRAFGSDVAADNELGLAVGDLPASSTGYFVTSQETILVATPGNSIGDLCIGSLTMGRYSATPQNTGMGSAVAMAIDLTAIPVQPGGPVAATAGSTWYWQYWYRDMDPATGASISNFSDAVCVTFQ